MSSEESFREEISAVIRRHDPDPDELRSLADDIKERARRAELTDEVI